MWGELDNYVNKYRMLDHMDVIIFGLSGGADSVCLARYLLYRRNTGGPDITAVHINHMLRGQESDRDEVFVQTFCCKWDISLYKFRKDVRQISVTNKMTLEEAGRKVRYECFREVMQKETAGKNACIAVAHHADDLAETMLFRMIRGTGPGGLVAIRPVQNDIIRPLLCIRKKKILELLHIMNQDYVEDSTNQDTEFSRNYIRHSILEEMEKLNPLAVEHLCSLSRQQDELMSFVGQEMEKLCRLVIERFPCGCAVEAEKVQGFPDYVRRELMRRLLFIAAGTEKDIGSVHVDQLLSLLYKDTGKQNHFPHDILALRKGTKLMLFKKERRPEQKEENISIVGEKEKMICVEVPLPAYRDGAEWSVSVNDEISLNMRYVKNTGQQIIKKGCEKCFDYDKIRNKLYVRTRREGDYFVFDDQGRHKRLSRYFIDNRIAKEERDRQLLLAEDSHILWILGGRISREYRITPETRRILEISFTVKVRQQQDPD